MPEQQTIDLPGYLDWPPIRRWVQREFAEGDPDLVRSRVASWTAMVDDHDVVRTRREGKVGWIELAYEVKGNAFVPPMYGLVHRAVRTFAADDSIWVIALTGSGRNFSSGGYVGPDGFFAGLDSGQDGHRTEPMRRTFVEMFQAMPRALHECEKPTVAVVNGLVAGEALDLILSADLRVMADDAEIWLSAAYSGNTGYSGAAYLLPKIVGAGIAKRLMFAAERIGAPDALGYGLVTDVFSSSELVREAQALCDRISSLPPITLRLIKHELDKSYEIGSYATALDLYAAIETIVQTTDDHMNAEEAIAVKAVPRVLGR